MCCAKQCVALYLYVTLCVFLEVSSRDRYALLLTKTENESERVWVYVYVCVCTWCVGDMDRHLCRLRVLSSQRALHAEPAMIPLR